MIPSPYVQNLRFGCASLADAYYESQIQTALLSKNEKGSAQSTCDFADTRTGVLNVPVPAAVSGELHYPYAPSHRGKRYFPYNEIFLHLISGLPILREGLFFLGHEAGVFHIQILHSRNPPWGQEPICENRSFSIAIYALTRFYNGICSRNRLLYYLRLEYIDFSDKLRYNLLALV